MTIFHLRASFILGPSAASASSTQGGSRSPKSGSHGSVRGAHRKVCPYRENPGAGSFQPPEVRTGTLFRRAVDTLFLLRPCVLRSRIGRKRRSIVAALPIWILDRISGSKRMWPWRSIASNSTGAISLRRFAQIRSATLRYHLEREAEKYRRSGHAGEDPARRARLEFGRRTQVEQQCRDSRGTKFVEDLLQDLHYAVRSFAKTPGLTALIVLSLAIGIGANTPIFSVTSTLLLKPLPYPAPDRIAILWLRSPGIGIPQDWPSPGQYHDIVTQNHVFEDTALAIGGNYTLTERSTAMKVDGIQATSSLLPMLGAKPMLGRIFLPEEDQPGKPETVVLTYGFWQREFASDPNIVGRAITLDGHPHTVVGVLSPGFRLNHEVIPTIAGIDKPDFFMPPPDEARKPDNYGPEIYNILARLKPGVTIQQAQSDIDLIAARLREEKHRDRSFTISVVPLTEQVVGNIRSAVLILFGAVALVLLIACTNVANLLLSRAAVRQREIAIRAALGAGRVRVMRQLLTESIARSLMGGVAGVAISALSIFIARKMHPGNIPRLEELGMDFRVLGFTFAISIFTRSEERRVRRE